ncbi:helix-turn-helix domain-containing protein [Streptomyces sp. NPDC051940]|uniref:helix-turn-helix domain-containing protein n=1 Tax=Streptomyces sp. NPDC051940 TaxID=3155675 RepID=UPI003423FE49
MPDRYLTPDDIAETFVVPVETVYYWRKRRIGPPGFRVGKHLRYDPVKVREWAREQQGRDLSEAA